MYITCTFTHMYMIKSDCYISGKFCFQISNYIQNSTMHIMYILYVLTRTILNLKFSPISECHTFSTHRILTKVSKIVEKFIFNNIQTIHKYCPVPQDFPKPQLFFPKFWKHFPSFEVLKFWSSQVLNTFKWT